MKLYLSILLVFFTLNLPGLSMAEKAVDETEYWEYTFRPGDSIWKIAETYTTTVQYWTEITRINNILLGPDREIQPGTRIVVPVYMLKKQPAPATVISIIGGAELIKSDGKKRDLSVGNKLYTGDKVITKNKQRVLMQFADESRLQVLSNSEVVLDQISYYKDSGMTDTSIRLNLGSVNTSVKKQPIKSRYRVITPSSVTAVRGTAFRISTDATELSTTEVLEGSVNVAGDLDDKNVNENYGIVVEKDKALPEPVKLLPPPDIDIDVDDSQREMSASWRRMEGAAYYRYILSKDDKFKDVIAESTTQDNGVDIAYLGVGNYSLQVSAVHNNKLQGHIAESKFEIEQHEHFAWGLWIGILLFLL